MTLRVDVSTLGKEIRDSLERGEAVEIERDGEVVACIPAKGREHERPPERIGWEEFFRRRREHEELDEDWERDLAIARQLLNEPVVSEPWEL